MEREEQVFRKRLSELANKAYRNNQYTFTSFLSLAEQDLYHQMERELSFVPATLFGGTEDCERLMIRFGSEELCGYEEEFPIVCMEVVPIVEKFAENLTHRDYLGALMNLGIERSTIGDIVLIEKRGYLFVMEKMAAYVQEQLTQIRHTQIRCKVAGQVPESVITNLEKTTCLVSSERIDGVIAKVFHLSRSQVIELFRGKKIFVDGRLMENNSATLKLGEKISVRGFGKFIYQGVVNETKKGKYNVLVEVYK